MTQVMFTQKIYVFIKLYYLVLVHNESKKIVTNLIVVLLNTLFYLYL